MRVSPFIGRRSDHMRRSKKREGSSGELTLPKVDKKWLYLFKIIISTISSVHTLTNHGLQPSNCPIHWHTFLQLKWAFLGKKFQTATIKLNITLYRSQTCFSMYEGLMRTTSMRSVSSLNSYRSHLNNSANNLDECNESPNILEHASGDDVFLSHNVEKLVI